MRPTHLASMDDTLKHVVVYSHAACNFCDIRRGSFGLRESVAILKRYLGERDQIPTYVHPATNRNP